MEDNYFAMFDVSDTAAAAPNPVRTTQRAAIKKILDVEHMVVIEG